MKHIRSSFAALAAILDDMGAAAFGADYISVQSSWQMGNASILPLVCSLLLQLPFWTMALSRLGPFCLRR